MIISITSDSSTRTKEIGKIFSKIITTHDIILLDGELGAGKTTFISGIAEGFGLEGNLSSPSFTLLNIYEINRKKHLVHADLYRLENIDEILSTGIEDYLYTRDKFICIEWGGKIKSYLNADYVEIEFSYILNGEYNDDIACLDQARSLVFKSENKYWIKKLKNLKRLMEKKGLTVN